MKSIFLILLAVFILAGCAQGSTGDKVVLAQSEKPRNTQPASSPAEQQELISGNSEFAFDLYKVLGAQAGNVFLSPYSISTALAMTQAGARGDTLAQMNQALSFTLPDQALHPAFNALQLSLNAREQNARDASKKDFTLKVTNALWGEKTYTFKPQFLDLLAENYAAGLRLVDFVNAPEASRQLINEWVSEQTEQKIKDLLPQGSINPLSRLVLTNAIYFKASWQAQFMAESTREEPFTLLDGSKTAVQMMHNSTSLRYARSADFQAVEIPYEGNKLAMLVVVPNQGQFAQVESALDAAQIASIIESLSGYEVNLGLPRFKVESSYNLVAPLQTLGLENAFIPGKADFSGMDGTDDLYISTIEHKAYINVDEKGTEAAAATAVVVAMKAMPAEVITLTIDRPFLYFILDRQTSSLLFMGRLVKP